MHKKEIVIIRDIAFTKLRKLEVYNLYNHIVSDLKKHDTKALHIESTCDVLIGMQEKADLLMPLEEARDQHSLTLVLQELHERRLKFAGIIANLMKTVERAGFEDIEHLVKLVKPFVSQYLISLREENLITVKAQIDAFFEELEDVAGIKNALIELGFERYLDELESANIEYEVNYSERRGQLSRRPKGSTIPIQRELQYVMRILFDQINHYQLVHKEVDYSCLARGVDHSVSIYTKAIKTRDTQRKNKKLKSKLNAAAALEEKLNKEKIDKKLADTVEEISATSPILPPNAKEMVKPSTSSTNKMGNDKPIDGLMHILKKPDKGKKRNDE